MIRSAIITAAIGVVFAAILFLLFRSDADIRNYPPKDGPIVAFGDSLVEGVGSTAGNDLPSILSRLAGEEIENLGKSGDTTAAGLARIDQAVSYKPRVAIVLLGGNDYLRRVPAEETFSNLRAIVSRLQESGAVVLVLGVRGGVLSDGYDDRFKELARETGSAYVPDVLDGLLGDDRYMSDAIHPNDRGYARIAEKVYPELKRIMR